MSTGTEKASEPRLSPRPGLVQLGQTMPPMSPQLPGDQHRCQAQGTREESPVLSTVCAGPAAGVPATEFPVSEAEGWVRHGNHIQLGQTGTEVQKSTQPVSLSLDTVGTQASGPCWSPLEAVCHLCSPELVVRSGEWGTGRAH